MKTYTLIIKRYGIILSFKDIEELKDELKRYFTKREVDSGVVERLTTFDESIRKDGCIKNKYQDFIVCCH